MRTIFIVHPHNNITYNVILTDLINNLIKENFRLVIFTNCVQSKTFFGKHPNVDVKVLPLFYLRPPRRPLLYWKKTFLPWLEARKELARHQNPEMICIDPEGFYTASRMFPSMVKKFNYISFEIFFRDELKHQLNINVHQRESRLVSKGIKSLVIQDPYRMKLFLQEHPEPKIEHTFYIPVSPSKISLPSEEEVKNFRFKTNMEPGKRSIIYSGSLYAWSGIKELITAMAKDWNDKFHLFIHSATLNAEMKKDLENFAASKVSNMSVTILDMKLTNEEYLPFLKQFDIGLATYVAFTSDSPYDGKNFAEIGYSSSKFNTLMMLGIPTIATMNNSFRDISERYNFGYVLKDFSEINVALKTIDQHFEQHKTGALAAYDQLLDPTEKVKKYIDYLRNEVSV